MTDENRSCRLLEYRDQRRLQRQNRKDKYKATFKKSQLSLVLAEVVRKRYDEASIHCKNQGTEVVDSSHQIVDNSEYQVCALCWP